MSFPLEISENIAKRLSLLDIFSLVQVNKLWHLVYLDEDFWKEMVHGHFCVCERNQDSWKFFFISLSKFPGCFLKLILFDASKGFFFSIKDYKEYWAEVINNSLHNSGYFITQDKISWKRKNGLLIFYFSVSSRPSKTIQEFRDFIQVWQCDFERTQQEDFSFYKITHGTSSRDDAGNLYSC